MANRNPNTSCKHCGKAFYAPPDRIARGNVLHCSSTCAAVAKAASEAARFWKRVEHGDGCWIYRGGATAYGRFRRYHANCSGSGTMISAHRMSWLLINGPIPDGLFVLHRCDIPRCVRPDHLFLGTAKDNSEDMVAKGRSARGLQSTMYAHPHLRRPGESNYSAKLTEDQIREIRQNYQKRHGILTQMARHYGVSIGLIGHIVKRRIWKHLI